MGQRNAYRILVEKYEYLVKRPLASPKRISEDNIKKDINEIGCDDLRCIEQYQYHVELLC